jgi:hypothetical protein
MPGEQRRLTAIFFTDIVACTALMGLDDTENALKILNKAIEDNDNRGLWFFSGFFDSIESDPRFQSLIQTFNLKELASL